METSWVRSQSSPPGGAVAPRRIFDLPRTGGSQSGLPAQQVGTGFISSLVFFFYFPAQDGSFLLIKRMRGTVLLRCSLPRVTYLSQFSTASSDLASSRVGQSKCVVAVCEARSEGHGQ